MFKEASEKIKQAYTAQLVENKSNYQVMYEILFQQKQQAISKAKASFHKYGNSRYINILNQTMDLLVQDWAKNNADSFGDYAESTLLNFKDFIFNMPTNLDPNGVLYNAINAYCLEPSKKNAETLKNECKSQSNKKLPGNIRQFIKDIDNRMDSIISYHELKESDKPGSGMTCN